MIELEERYPGAIADIKRKAKASIAKAKARDEFIKKGNYRFGIDGNFKPKHIVPDKIQFKKSWLKIPKFDGAHVDLTDDGIDLVISFK